MHLNEAVIGVGDEASSSLLQGFTIELHFV